MSKVFGLYNAVSRTLAGCSNCFSSIPTGTSLGGGNPKFFQSCRSSSAKNDCSLFLGHGISVHLWLAEARGRFEIRQLCCKICKMHSIRAAIPIWQDNWLSRLGHSGNGSKWSAIRLLDLRRSVGMVGGKTKLGPFGVSKIPSRPPAVRPVPPSGTMEG